MTLNKSFARDLSGVNLSNAICIDKKYAESGRGISTIPSDHVVVLGHIRTVGHRIHNGTPVTTVTVQPLMGSDDARIVFQVPSYDEIQTGLHSTYANMTLGDIQKLQLTRPR